MGENTFTLKIGNQTRTASITVNEVKDIVMFVAGTTDPVNVTNANHEANKTYWQGECGDLDNLWSQVKALKPQYLDLHIEDNFFSWSGDNNNAERTKAAERLLDLFMRVYSQWTEKEVCLHLIGHSHGGNVINQFTEIISENSAFPKKWQVKSITYLSTPFFKKQHQLNHTKLHSDCKIINVYNEYDITQRFVADFTLKNLEGLIFDLNPRDFEAALDKIKKTDFDAFDHLSDLVINNHTEGPFLWRETGVFLDGVKDLFDASIRYISCIDDSGPLSGHKAELLGLLRSIRNWADSRSIIFKRNQVDRDEGYGRSEFFEDLDVLTMLRLMNTLLAIETGEEDSYLLNLLDNIFNPKYKDAVTDTIDDTNWNPEKQVNGAFEIIEVPITEHDPYHAKNKKANFDEFIEGIERCVQWQSNILVQELMMRLISQLVPPMVTQEIIDKLFFIKIYFTGEKDKEIIRFEKNIRIYHDLLVDYFAGLVTEADLKNETLNCKPGSLPYLAIVSHSLSHSQLFPVVKDALISTFESGRKK